MMIVANYPDCISTMKRHRPRIQVPLCLELCDNKYDSLSHIEIFIVRDSDQGCRAAACKPWILRAKLTFILTPEAL